MSMGTQLIRGKYTSATIFATNNKETAIDEYATAQLQMLCDLEANKGCRIRVMPDVHPGKVGTIGLTMTIGDKIMPNLTGIDIGCGMSLVQIKDKKIEFQKLDTVIRDSVPSGFSVRTKTHPLAEQFAFENLHCKKHLDINHTLLSCGSLGSGNHFIEVDQDSQKNTFVIVHTGSRRLGKEITEYYLEQGQKYLKEKGISIPYELTYLEGELMEHYLNDIKIAQNYATTSREIILCELMKGMKWKPLDFYSCHHNYVDFSSETLSSFGSPMLRKGAISAKEGEKVIIPINMREGIILGTGRGNTDWNCSAPHGSGRVIQRELVKGKHTLSEFKKVMKGIYSPSINKDTLDEAPFAYRTLEEITEVVSDTIIINNIIRPVYNFKAGGK